MLDIDQKECVYDLLSVLIKELKPKKNANRIAQQISLLDILRFCTNKKLYVEFSPLELKELYPGYYKAKLRICKKDDIIYELLDADISIGYIENVAHASIVNTSRDGNCQSIEIDIANTVEQEWDLNITVKFDTSSSIYSWVRQEIRKTYKLKLKASQGGRGEYIKLQKPYNYLREGIIHASNGVGRYFRDIKGNGVKLPTFWLCRKIYEDYTIKQSTCKTMDSSLSALIYEPVVSTELLGNKGVKPTELFKNYPKEDYVYPPLAYSEEARALFFEIPAYGTIEIYKKRILHIPSRDLLLVIKSLVQAVESYRFELGEHGLIVSWNIFLTSRGIKLGPPRSIANKLFGIPLESRLGDYQMLSRVILSMADDLLDRRSESSIILRTYVEKIAGALEDWNLSRVYRIISEWEDRLL